MTKHTSKSSSATNFILGDWHVEPQTSTLLKGQNKINVEPKVMDLLVLLAMEPGRVYSRADIESVLWPEVVVGEDSLARAISKLRRALDDNANAPTYIETIPKRGYRLIADVSKVSTQRPYWIAAALGIIAIGLMAWVGSITEPSNENLNGAAISENAKLINRADDLYMRFNRADNEAAISLYQRVIADNPSDTRAQAGLANALVQRVVRWQQKPDAPQIDAPTLTKALKSGLTETADGRELLSRAASMAERAVRLSPDDPRALKALAFTYSAQGELDRAVELYGKTIAIDKDAWESLINLGEIYTIQGEPELSNNAFKQAYAVMDRVYANEPQKVGPWQAPLGITIGENYEALGAMGEAERWYRRVLELIPFEPKASTKLVSILRETERSAEADSLCKALSTRVGLIEGCS